MPAKSSYMCALLAVTLMTGCGGKETENQTEEAAPAAMEEEAPATSEAQATSEVGAASGNPTTAPLTKDDIERWEKGMAGEMKAVQDAAAKMKAARTSEDTLTAMMGVQEMNTWAAGAQAAGLEQERYKFIRSNLSAVVGYLTPSFAGMDTTMLSQAQRDELRQGNEAQLKRMETEVPADVVEAIRPRAIELRKKDMELVGARLKGAGMTQ
jgi:hypothetical protein